MVGVNHPINKEELRLLNNYSDNLIDAAKFYKDNLSKGRISYLYKQNGNMKVLTVKFAESNFAHLTGLWFAERGPKKFLDDLANEKTTQKGIFVKKDGTTFQKLAVIGGLQRLTDPTIMELNDLSKVPQSHRLRFTEALKIKDEGLLLALINTDFDLYSPVSLLNLNDTRGRYNDYSKVPENQVLAVLSETPNGLGGANISVVSVNEQYLSQEDLFQVGQAMTELSLKAMQRIADGDRTAVRENEEAFDQLMNYFDEEARKASQQATAVEMEAEVIEQAAEQAVEPTSADNEDSGPEAVAPESSRGDDLAADNDPARETNEGVEPTALAESITEEAAQNSAPSSASQVETAPTAPSPAEAPQPTQSTPPASETAPTESAATAAPTSPTPQVEKASVAAPVQPVRNPAPTSPAAVPARQGELAVGRGQLHDPPFLSPAHLSRWQ